MKYRIEAYAARAQSKEYKSDVKETLSLAFEDIINKIKSDKDFNEGRRFIGNLTELKDDDLDEHDFVGQILRELRHRDRESIENGICEMELKELNSMLIKWIRRYLKDNEIELSPFINRQYGAIELVKAEEKTIVLIDNKYWGKV